VSSTDFQIRNLRQSTIGVQDDRPLTERELNLVQRLFSDPFSFPLAFKAWLVSYLETSDMSLPMSSVSGLQKTLGITGAGQGTLGIFPAGVILPYGGEAAPDGALLCDGTAYATATEVRLFAAIGYRWGGSGATFNVPDFRGRFPVGKGPHVDVDTLGKSDGYAANVRRPTHRTSDLGWESAGTAAGPNNVVEGNVPTPGGGETGTHHHGPDDGLIDTVPYSVVNYIIVN
jgi:microcystin-dependent protein